MRSLCVIPGDGIGPEVTDAATRVLRTLAPDVGIQEAEAGFAVFQRTGTALPAATVAAVRACDATLLGAVGSPTRRVEGYRSPVVRLRRELGLFACIRPVTTPPLAAARPDVDLVIFREATEGLYVGRERRDGDIAVSERVVTVEGSRNIARAAARYAATHGRGRVTVVHKANVLRETCGLFREIALEELSGNDFDVDEMIVDAAACRLVEDPSSFDVIVTTNLFGDLLSDVAAPWAGGLGLCASATVGHEHAVFEPVHGSAPDIAGRGIANPLATLRALAMALDHTGRSSEAEALRTAVDDTIADGPRTPDLDGDASTDLVVDAVLRRLQHSSAAGSLSAASNTSSIPVSTITGESR